MTFYKSAWARQEVGVNTETEFLKEEKMAPGV